VCVDEGGRNPGIAESSGERTATGPQAGWGTREGGWPLACDRTQKPDSVHAM